LIPVLSSGLLLVGGVSLLLLCAFACGPGFVVVSSFRMPATPSAPSQPQQQQFQGSKQQQPQQAYGFYAGMMGQSVADGAAACAGGAVTRSSGLLLVGGVSLLLLCAFACGPGFMVVLI
jgi:hypothetical protein